MRVFGLALVSVALVGASPVAQLPPAQSISATDRAAGAQQNAQILNEFGGAYVGPQASLVTNVGRRVAGQSGVADSDRTFTITLLNSPVDNAFAIPGGYVYCTRQLLALMNNEAELAFVLGHESGHIAARHPQKRQNMATRNSVLGALGGLLVGKVVGNNGFGQLLQRGIGTGAQLATLSYSRQEEYEADDLGVQFADRAGYDPRAAATILASIDAQSKLDQRSAGTSRSTPTFASTHPDAGSRVQRALNRAQQLASRNTYRNNVAFLNALDGLPYGEDPRQGAVVGNDFKYPVGRVQFSAPQGFGISNGANAVTIAGNEGQAQFAGGRFDGNLGAYIESVFAKVGGQGNVGHSATQPTKINGIDAAYASASARTSDGKPVDVTVVAFAITPSQAYHFLVVTPQGQGLGALTPLVQSFRRMSQQEAAAVRPRKISIVSVGPGDTVDRLASKMAFEDLQRERFLVLNGLSGENQLFPGRRIKLIVYG